MLLEVKFNGGVADEHKIPAYEGVNSLEGLTRSIMIVSNFLVEGRVRRKEFGKVPLHFNLVAQQPGSFEAVYEVVYHAAAIGAPLVGDLAGGIAGNLLTDLLKTVYRRATGVREDDVSERVEQLEIDRGGDVSALVEAVEPSVRLSHNIINHGVINITINQGGPAPAPIARLDRDTKQYMWESVIDDNLDIKLFSIGSFNANQGSGRAYDIEEGRSVPFDLAKEVDRQTVQTLIDSISSYAMRRMGDNLRSAIYLKYTAIRAVDGRIKKIRIYAARREIEDF